MVKIECQTFIYYHVHLLRYIKFAGYVTNHFDTGKLTLVKKKSTLLIKLDMKIKKKHLEL